MDYYGTDRKLSELGEQDLEDFLDQDMFTPAVNDTPMPMDTFGLVDNTDDSPMDNEWLDNFFDDPVLNDRMMTDALQPRRVQSEHSYSLTNEEKVALNGQVKAEVTEKDLDIDLLGSAINPNMTLTSGSTSIIKASYLEATGNTVPPACSIVKQEPATPGFSQQEIAMATNSITSQPTPIAMTTTRVSSHPTPHPQTLLKQPTIILATTTSASSSSSLSQQSLGGDTIQLQTSVAGSASAIRPERLVLPKVNIKMEPAAFNDTASNMSSPEHSTMYDSIGLPPTPPSSSNSDSEGGHSPQRSAPPSPIRHSQLRQHSHHSLGGVPDAFSQPLFTSPIPTSGVLILSEEEKRTLVTEGYPIPNKLPLTKQEEKNLKKIRRKIKNKISAQESRRKKKEYLETLEKKVEAYNCENSDLKKKVESLENNNRSLLGQLQKLQSLVAKVPRPPTPSSQTGTCLMVLVLFFAVFMGTWSPLTWSIGYGTASSVASVGAVDMKTLSGGPSVISIRGPTGQPIGPEIQEPLSDPYTSHNMPRSRVLLSLKEEPEEPFGPNMPFSYNSFFMRWFSGADGSSASCSGDVTDYSMVAPVPDVHDVTEPEAESAADTVDVMMDVSVNYTAQVMTRGQLVNTTA